MTNKIKRIDIKEFRKLGYLQEVNRRFLHPLGMALEVIIDEETNEEKLGSVWDYRDDPEGILYADSLMQTEAAEIKADNIRNEMKNKLEHRTKQYGWGLQPVGKRE